ncbi:hypothetical protein ACFVZD_48390, partial [Streptomyces sp. NPDC058287]|uniref:hypothetical protein n=1 Tax=Streptomyces sp. NPDC058287 TaxID=3346423 RepID=UPI0036E3DF3D
MNVNVPVPVMCLVAPKSAQLHDPMRIWKCSDIDNAVYASDWQYAGSHLESTDGTSAGQPTGGRDAQPSLDAGERLVHDRAGGRLQS